VGPQYGNRCQPSGAQNFEVAPNFWKIFTFKAMYVHAFEPNPSWYRGQLSQMIYINPTGHNTSLHASSTSAGQHISCILWKRNVHYRVHNSLLLMPTQDRYISQDFKLFNIQFNIIPLYKLKTSTCCPQVLLPNPCKTLLPVFIPTIIFDGQ
jgi:hypothetical protein